MRQRFRDRRDAGRALGRMLQRYAGRDDVTVLALPRGGVVVGYEVALALHVSLDVLIVRKLGVPGHEELGFGAIASGGVCVLNQDLVRELRISEAIVKRVVEGERGELERRERVYRGQLPPLDVRGRTVILADDGLATGATMLAAVGALRTAGAASIVTAVPVASRDACATLRDHVDACICAWMPEPFTGVGAWYDDFAQTRDAEVTALLAASRSRMARNVRDLHAVTGESS